MGLIKKDKAGGGALGALRRQKDIVKKIETGEAVPLDATKKEALVVLVDMSPSMSMHQDAGVMARGDLRRWRERHGTRAYDAAVRATGALVDASTMSRVGALAFCAFVPPHRICPIGKSGAEIVDHLKRFDPMNGRGTDFTSAINAGLDMLEAHTAAPVRRLILLTDGCDGRHSGAAAAERMETRLAASGVILDAVGFGDVNHEELKRLVAIGNGTYHASVTGAALVKTFKQLEAGARGLLGSGS